MRDVLKKGDPSISEGVSGMKGQSKLQGCKVLSLGAWNGGTMARRERSQERGLA